MADVSVPDDRPRDQLREECYEERQLNRPLLRWMRSAIDIDEVGDRLEREEGDANREVDLFETGEGSEGRGGRRNADGRAEPSEVARDESGVFESTEEK